MNEGMDSISIVPGLSWNKLNFSAYLAITTDNGRPQ